MRDAEIMSSGEKRCVGSGWINRGGGEMGRRDGDE